MRQAAPSLRLINQNSTESLRYPSKTLGSGWPFVVVTLSLAWLKLAVSLFSDTDKPSYRFVLSSQSVRVFMAAGFHVAIWGHSALPTAMTTLKRFHYLPVN